VTSAGEIQRLHATPRRSVRQMLSAYARLANLKVYFQWIPALVGWSLVHEPLRLAANGLFALLLYVLAVIAIACSAGALDDLQGLRDGLDVLTYAQDDPLRGVSEKPLVRKELSAAAAHRFALVVGLTGGAAGTVAVLLAPHGSPQLTACWLVAAYAATQYSYGVKLSYHGAGELLLGLEAAAVMLIPLAFLSGGVSAAGWYEACLLGTLFAQVTVFSSSRDAEIDRACGRLTIAARLSPSGNRRFIATVFVAGWLVSAAGFASGSLDLRLAVALLPTWALQVAQLRAGVRRSRWLRARLLGWRAFDAGVVALVLVNLFAG
jgi:1,4-dihydroxy-2-naphthoate octaprenyltransferase